MTETCAGSIYNLECPSSDLKNGHDFTSVGKCINGIEMRITLASGSMTTELAAPNELGNHEVRGDIVFKGYYRQPEANSEAFTPDGWFRTSSLCTIFEITPRKRNLRLSATTHLFTFVALFNRREVTLRIFAEVKSAKLVCVLS
ncbi:hypothetical protein F4810DRAFT_678759 [Camillea tinctor]|nr:hypothetical protein F4810DRAFT_678759 [Camillea tinctor]